MIKISSPSDSGLAALGEKPYKSGPERCVQMRGKPPRAVGEIFIPRRACTDFCDTFNMRSLSPNDDSQKSQRRVIGRRRRVEGVATRAITVRNKKNSAIVRVCQLRMIVWLVEPPPVSSADHPCASRR